MLIDLHTHTHPLSWDSSLAPDDVIDIAKQRGIEGIVFTEHDSVFHPDDARALARRHNFVVFAGIEMNVEEGHVLVYGLHQYEVAMHRISDLATRVQVAGGAIVAAHPYRRWMPEPVVLQTMEWDDHREYRQALQRAETASLFNVERLCAMDVLNGRATHKQNGFSHELCSSLGLPRTGASDSHQPEDVGRAATYFERPITSEDVLVEELLAGRVWAIDLTQGSLTEDPQYHDVPSNLHERWEKIGQQRRKWTQMHAIERQS